ncbi:general odorant-binding protein 57d [Drosophila gunungcola]|uniref:general odorant-binding protein 57d n=1 Tax=Drosophila gunungcola TaxID=103775 RepID=UPI0022E7CBEB|nr:general odorant-binding protein 57d [Drosophila gunungcola]
MLVNSRLVCIIFLLQTELANSEYTDPCTDHNGITVEEANRALADWPMDLDLASVNKTHKCYVTCILIYFNLADDYGGVTLDKYFNYGIIDEFAFAPTLSRCCYEYSAETDLCEKIFGVFNCFRQERLLNEK